MRWLALIPVLLGVGLLISSLPGGAGSRSDADSGPQRVVVGSGDQAASIWRVPGADPGPVVVFLHGWGLEGPRAYRPFLEHLARRGNTVIVPRYQTSLRTRPDRALANTVAGVRTALRRVRVGRGGLVLAGHSAGGALAVDLAASAERLGLPAPRGLLVVYPGRAIRNFPAGIPERDLSTIAPTTKTVIMASALDRVVGDGPARQLSETLTANGVSAVEFVAVRDPVVAEHYAPARSALSSRRLFWRRLDRLIGRVGPSARASNGGGGDDRAG